MAGGRIILLDDKGMVWQRGKKNKILPDGKIRCETAWTSDTLYKAVLPAVKQTDHRSVTDAFVSSTGNSTDFVTVVHQMQIQCKARAFISFVHLSSTVVFTSGSF